MSRLYRRGRSLPTGGGHAPWPHLAGGAFRGRVLRPDTCTRSPGPPRSLPLRSRRRTRRTSSPTCGRGSLGRSPRCRAGGPDLYFGAVGSLAPVQQRQPRVVRRLAQGWALYWRWLLLTVFLTVVLPIGVAGAVVAWKGHDVTWSTVTGRGEFFLMALAMVASGLAALYSPGAVYRGWLLSLVIVSAISCASLASCWGIVSALAAAESSFDVDAVVRASKAAISAAFVFSTVCIGAAPFTVPDDT